MKTGYFLLALYFCPGLFSRAQTPATVPVPLGTETQAIHVQQLRAFRKIDGLPDPV
jgi:hypothetical protein